MEVWHRNGIRLDQVVKSGTASELIKDWCLAFEPKTRAKSTPECDIRMDFDTNEYPNIFVSRKWHKQISEYIRMNIFDTNEYPNIFVLKFWYERISE